MDPTKPDTVGAYHVLSNIASSTLSHPMLPDLALFCTKRLALSALNKKDNSKSTKASAGDKASKLSPVLFVNNSPTP